MVSIDKNIQIVEKPVWVTWEDIHVLLVKAHRHNMEQGMTMRSVILSGLELEAKVGEGQCFVALNKENQLIGTAAVRVKTTHYWFAKGKTALLELCAVLPAYQGFGIIGQLLQKCLAYVRDRQVSLVIMDTAERNTRMRQVMKKNGFRYVSFFTTKYSKHHSVMVAKWLDECPYSKWYCWLRYYQKRATVKLLSLPQIIQRYIAVKTEMYVGKSTLRSLKSARTVSLHTSELTGKSWLYHFFDFLRACLLHGCSANHYQNEFFYQLRSFDRSKTVTVGRKNKICRLFNLIAYSNYFGDKVHFNETFKDYMRRDWIFTGSASYSQLEDFVNSHDKILVKPIDRNKGQGIHLLDKSMPQRTIIEKLSQEEVLLEEFIIQHHEMCFGGHSVNSIRVITVLDRSAHVHVLKAGLRCGVEEAVTDNFSSGGVFYPLNLEGGFIEGYGKDKSHYVYSGLHPGTQEVVIGRRIPHWNQVLQIVKNAAMRIPQVRYVGWDVAVRPDGVELIEGNHNPGCTLLESIGEKRGFYKEIMSYF